MPGGVAELAPGTYVCGGAIPFVVYLELSSGDTLVSGGTSCGTLTFANANSANAEEQGFVTGGTVSLNSESATISGSFTVEYGGFVNQ